MTIMEAFCSCYSLRPDVETVILLSISLEAVQTLSDMALALHEALVAQQNPYICDDANTSH